MNTRPYRHHKMRIRRRLCALVLINDVQHQQIGQANQNKYSTFPTKRQADEQRQAPCFSHAMLICDEGKEAEYIRLVRKMGVHNPIPSRFGVWLDSGQTTRNLTIDRILEDPFFKESDKSYFVQLADFCAYGLLRREKHLASKNKYNIHTCFDELQDVVVKAANPRDSMGVIR